MPSSCVTGDQDDMGDTQKYLDCSTIDCPLWRVIADISHPNVLEAVSKLDLRLFFSALFCVCIR
jgi:hypothetical protein